MRAGAEAQAELESDGGQDGAGRVRQEVPGGVVGEVGAGELVVAQLQKLQPVERWAAPDYQSAAMYLVSRNSIIPSWEPSRPIPDCLTPPKGAAGSE